MTVKAGAIATPGSTGNLAVTGLGFEPTWVFLMAVDATSSDTWIVGGVASMSQGQMSKDNTGTLVQCCRRIVFEASNNVASGFVTTRVVELSTARGNMGTNVLLACSAVSLDADGFTLNFSTATSGYEIFYVCSDDTAQMKLKRATGLYGMNLGVLPEGVMAIGISDTAGLPPNNWNGIPWTSCWAVGHADTSGANRTISWSPGHNTNERWQELQGPAAGNIWGAADDPAAFGTVITGEYVGAVNGFDFECVTQGAGAGTNMTALALGDIHAGATESVATSASVGGTVIDTSMSFNPSWAIVMGGSGQGHVKDAAHTGFSVGCITENGEQWLIAFGTKIGSAPLGPAVYKSTTKSWMSGWGPYNNPTTQNDGTSQLITHGVRFTTVNNTDAVRDLFYAAFGPTKGTVETFIPQFFRLPTPAGT